MNENNFFPFLETLAMQLNILTRWNADHSSLLIMKIIASDEVKRSSLITNACNADNQSNVIFFPWKVA